MYGHRVQALIAERERIELRETLRDLQEKVCQNSLQIATAARALYIPPSNAAEATLHIEQVGPLVTRPATRSHFE